MGDLATLATAGGGLGVLAWVIFYLLNANRVDRREYLDAVDRAEKRATAAEERAEGLQIALDEVRAARRRAEDRADDLGRQLLRYRPNPPDGGP